MSMSTTLSTDRLTLGPLGQEHFEAVAAFYATDRAAYVGGQKSRSLSWRQLAAEIGHWTLRGFGRFAVSETATGAFVGIVGPWHPEGFPEPEIGWDLWDGFEGRGYATEAGHAARAWCYGSLGWSTAISLIDARNPGSEGVARRLGCHFERAHELVNYGPINIWRHPSSQDLS